METETAKVEGLKSAACAGSPVRKKSAGGKKRKK
jgi:hypothetical protein